MPLELHVLTAIIQNCSFEALNDAEYLMQLLEESARVASLTILETTMKRFEPYGVTGVSILGQSHIAIHTWPEQNRMFIDIATCSTIESAECVLQHILSAMKGTRVESQHLYTERA